MFKVLPSVFFGGSNGKNQASCGNSHERDVQGGWVVYWWPLDVLFFLVGV